MDRYSLITQRRRKKRHLPAKKLKEMTFDKAFLFCAAKEATKPMKLLAQKAGFKPP